MEPARTFDALPSPPLSSGPVPRTLIVGFDGATLDLCERWIDGMPTLRGLMADGAHGTLRSTLPANSAVAWTSLSTGATPGRHGIFDFVLPRSGTYGYRVTTRADRRVPALWNHASDAGARVAVVNIPMTFPAEPVNGIMVSGMDAPHLEPRAVHPESTLEEIRRLSPRYRIISNAHLPASRGDFETAERELLDALEARSRFLTEISRARHFDLVMANLEATDGAHHFFWQHLDPSHPRHDRVAARRWGEAIRRVYEASDRELGRLVDAYGAETVFVVSDHGGGPSSDWVLFLNDWLAADGFLHVVPRRLSSAGARLYGEAKKRLSVPLRRRLRPLARLLDRAKDTALYGDVEWSRTRAYAFMQPAVHLNVVGREPSGSVSLERRDAVLDEVADAARALRLPGGQPAFEEVHRAADVYGGDMAPGSPDLVMEPAPGLHIRSRNTTRRPGPIHRLSELDLYLPSGVHTRTGMVVAAGSGIAHTVERGSHDIHQVAPSVLAVAGVAGPRFDAPPFSFVTIAPIARGARHEGAGDERTDLDPTEEEEVLSRLRGLGYVD
jgi:predicted AlkP superfamily phosphohydrolase/phosphomutase